MGLICAHVERKMVIVNFEGKMPRLTSGATTSGKEKPKTVVISATHGLAVTKQGNYILRIS